MTGDLLMIQYLAAVFVAVLALLWVVLESSRKPPKRREKSRIFACGMDAVPQELNVPQDSYYNYMLRFLRTGALARAHSGKLSDYIAWIIIGTAIMAVFMVMLW